MDIKLNFAHYYNRSHNRKGKYLKMQQPLEKNSQNKTAFL
jgi:hypothetical protein